VSHSFETEEWGQRVGARNRRWRAEQRAALAKGHIEPPDEDQKRRAKQLAGGAAAVGRIAQLPGDVLEANRIAGSGEAQHAFWSRVANLSILERLMEALSRGRYDINDICRKSVITEQNMKQWPLSRVCKGIAGLFSREEWCALAMTRAELDELIKPYLVPRAATEKQLTSSDYGGASSFSTSGEQLVSVKRFVHDVHRRVYVANELFVTCLSVSPSVLAAKRQEVESKRQGAASKVTTRSDKPPSDHLLGAVFVEDRAAPKARAVEPVGLNQKKTSSKAKAKTKKTAAGPGGEADGGQKNGGGSGGCCLIM
jgi:hypothetical protein